MGKPLSIKSEDTYKAVVDNAGIALAVIEEDMTVVFVNREFLSLFECTRDKVEGRKWSEYIPRESINMLEQFHKTSPDTTPV